MDEETRSCFQSDFRKVADFFYKQRVGEDPLEGEEVLQHPLAYIDFLRVYAKDAKYGMIKKWIQQKIAKGEEIKMCTVVEGYINEGRKQGRKEGRKEGRDDGIKAGREMILVKTIQSLMKNLGQTAEAVMDLLEIPMEERAKYLKRI